MSQARQNFTPELEALLNGQIHMEQNASYTYRAMWAYFARDSVALPGFAKFLEKSANEEAEHAQKFMEYQLKRGGVVRLGTLNPPQVEYSNSEIGDLCFCMEKVLELEKQVNANLLELHRKADEAGDLALANFIDEFLEEQVDAIKEIAGYVTQLRRIGTNGMAIYMWDRDLGC